MLECAVEDEPTRRGENLVKVSIEKHSSISSVNTDSVSMDLLDAEKFKAEVLSNSSTDIFKQVTKQDLKPNETIKRHAILESVESISSVETAVLDDKFTSTAPTSKHRDKRKDFYKRMASDTDLWMSLKGNQSKFQSSLQSTDENFTLDNNDSKRGNRKGSGSKNKDGARARQHGHPCIACTGQRI